MVSSVFPNYFRVTGMALVAVMVAGGAAAADQSLRFPPEQAVQGAPMPGPSPFWNTANLPGQLRQAPPRGPATPAPPRRWLYGDPAPRNNAAGNPPPANARSGPDPQAARPYPPVPPRFNGPPPRRFGGNDRGFGPMGRPPFGKNGIFGQPSRWFRGKEGMAQAWDDMLRAPSRMGRMPPGWYFPEISTPNPVDVGDQLGVGAKDFVKEVPDFIQTVPDMISIDPNY